MNPSRWKEIKEAFAQVSELDKSERSGFLSSLGEDVRLEVEKLLNADSKAGSFIESPFLVENGSVSDGGFAGKQIDAYVLLEEIGAGGMGTVYLAEHRGEGFSQKVALKLIKRGMDTEAVLNRFLIERQILANLDHPYIARMLDGGSTPDGLPYFVMEHVEGEPIRSYCDVHDLDARSRVELFTKVCTAVSYAHQKLVVHRDLKPSNILINESGEPKLLDFGIAKLLSPEWRSSAETLTATQFRILTPEYASPEQLRGESTTTATDVYSLGVVLYELLTGVRPFQNEKKSASEQIVATEPKKPSLAALFGDAEIKDANATARGSAHETGNGKVSSATRRSVPDPGTLRGDLDNIVLKAIRSEPERRYQSVQELIEDLERYLNGLPVKATADTISYRVGKFVKRHRAGFAATAFAGVLLVSVASVAVWQAMKANEERKIAEARFKDIRALANSLIFDVHDSIRDLPGSTPARKEIVARALEYLDKLAKEGPKDMSLQLELAAGYEKVGDVQGYPLGPNLGETAAAAESYAKALAIRESIFADISTEERYDTALLHSKLFRIQLFGGKLTEAEEHCARATSIVDELIVADRSNDLYLITAARFHQELGDLQQTRDPADFDSAVDNYKKAISLCDSITPSPESAVSGPDGLNLNEKIRDVTQMAYRRLGGRYESQDNTTEALAAFSKALVESETLYAAGVPQKPQAEMVVAIALSNAGRLEAATGNGSEGLAKVKRAIDICERAVASDPKNYLATTELGLAHWNAGNIHFILNDQKTAMSELQKALDIQNKLRVANANDLYNLGNLADTYASIASIHEKGNDLTQAREAYKKSYDIWKGMKDADMLPGYYSYKPEKLLSSIERISAS